MKEFKLLISEIISYHEENKSSKTKIHKEIVFIFGAGIDKYLADGKLWNELFVEEEPGISK